MIIKDLHYRLNLETVYYVYHVYLNNVFRYHEGKMCSTSEGYFDI